MDSKRFRELFNVKTIIRRLEIPTSTQNLYAYIDDKGLKRYHYRLVDGTDYFFGGQNQEIRLINNEGNSLGIAFYDKNGLRSVGEMLSSQLQGQGGFLYYSDDYSEGISIGTKKNLTRLVQIDETLKKAFLNLVVVN